MCDSLIFPTSVIFSDPRPIDLIHQAQIDVSSKNPSLEIVTQYLLKIIQLDLDSLNNDTQFEEDLYALIYQIVSEFDVAPVFENFKSQMKNSPIKYLSAIIFADALASKNATQELIAFANEVLVKFSDNIKSRQIDGLTFSDNEILFGIHHLLCILPLTEELIKEYVPLLFPDTPTQYRFDLVVHIASSGLIHLIPKQYLTEVSSFKESYDPAELFLKLIPYYPVECFNITAKDLELFVISIKNYKVVEVFFQKCKELNYTKLEHIQELIDILPASSLTPEMIGFLSNFDFIFNELSCSEITDFTNIDFYIQRIQEPQRYLNEEKVEEYLLNCNDPKILKNILKPLFVHPLLSKTETWLRIIDLFETDDYKEIGKCYVANQTDIGGASIKLLSPITGKVSAFLRVALATKDLKTQFTLHKDMQRLLLSIESQPPYSFWKLFTKSRGIIEFCVAANYRCPYVMYGLVTVTSFTKFNPNFETIFIEEQTEESLTKVKKYLKQKFTDKTSLFNSIDGKPAELSLIAAGHYYGTRLSYRQTPLPKIEGLNTDNILPFIIITCTTYGVTTRLHAAPALMTIFQDSYLFNLINEALVPGKKFLRKFWEVLLLSMPSLSNYWTFNCKIKPIFLRFWKEKAMVKNQACAFIMNFSHSLVTPTSFLKRNVLNNEGYIPLPEGEPTKQNMNEIRELEGKFFDELGDDMFDFLASNDYPDDFPIKYDCQKDDNIKLNLLVAKNPDIQTVRFIHFFTIKTPKLSITDTKPYFDLLNSLIENKKWKDSQTVIAFLIKHVERTQLESFLNQNLPPSINYQITNGMEPFHIRKLITQDFVIELMAQERKILELKVRNFIDSILADEDTEILRNIYNLERIQRNFCITTQTVVTYYWSDIEKTPDTFAKAVNAMYISPKSVPTILIRRPTNLEVNPPSEFSLSIAHKLMDVAFERRTYTLFCWLQYLCCSRPFLFDDFDHNMVFDELMNIIYEEELNFKVTSSAVFFLYTYIQKPKVADAFFDYFFSQRNKFTESQVLVIFYIINSFLLSNSVKHVMAGLMKRYNWFSFVPSKNLIPKWIEITKLMLEILDSRIDHEEIDTIINMGNSFYMSYSDLQSIRNLLLETHPLKFVYDKLNDENKAFVNKLTRDRLFKRETESFNSKQLQDLLAKVRTDEEMFYPEWANAEAFSHLTEKSISTILHHKLPKLPMEITSNMKRYLATKPRWIGAWICNPSTILLLPIHYKYLYNTITELNNLHDDILVPSLEHVHYHHEKPADHKPPPAPEPIPDEPDEPPHEEQKFAYIENSEKDMDPFRKLSTKNERVCCECGGFIDEMFFSTRKELLVQIYESDEFNNLLHLLVLNETEGFKSLVEVVSKHHSNPQSFFNTVSANLSNYSQQEFIGVLKIILYMCGEDKFKKCLTEEFTRNMIYTAIRLQFRKCNEVLGLTSKILANIDNPPKCSLHLLMFMLNSGNSAITEALVPYSKLDKESAIQILPSITTGFETLIQKSLQYEVQGEELLEFVRVLPEYSMSKRNELLKILDRLFTRYDKSKADLIVSFFEYLVPPKEQWKIKINSSEIPKELFDQDPLFWNILQNHHDIISKLISMDNKRIEKEFAVMKTFPFLLDFPLKLNLFNSKIKKLLTSRRKKMKIRRDHIIEDSYRKIQQRIDRQTFLGELVIQFVGEQGLDMGGVKRDWYTHLIRELFSPDYGLFTSIREPSQNSYVNSDHLAYFYFTGLVLARAILDGINVDCHLPVHICKALINSPIKLRDLEAVDVSLYNSLTWILENDVTDLDMQFTVDIDDFGTHKTKNLIDGGDNISVTNENKDEYVQLMLDHRLKHQTKMQTLSFVGGFHSIIPPEHLLMFTPNELDLIICGVPKIDIKDMKDNCSYIYPLNSTHPIVMKFFNVIRHWCREDLAKLLLFITGSSQVPVGGFKVYKDRQLPFTLAAGGDCDRLPVAHTCTNTLDLPSYQTEKEMNEKLLFAISECNSFGFE